MPEIISLPFAFFFGLIFGSFANVCIYRLPRSKPFIWNRSFCPNCKKIIGWYDNIPLASYLNLSGKCRKCKKKIPAQYFLVEFISGLAFLFIYLTNYSVLAKIVLAVLFLVYLIIFFIDLKHYIIPDVLSFGLIFFAFIKNFFLDLGLNFTQNLEISIIGGIVGYFSIWSIIYLYLVIKKIEGMGLGDAKLMAGLGLLFGWQSIPLVLFISSFLGLIIVLPSLISKKINLKTKIPFGPYIITAGLIYYCFGEYLYSLIL
ncbi:MAG: prepilin peptidase [bacterium]|nr:prepilin peptidase [bacterium]